MRFGKWRGASLAFAVAAVVGLGLSSRFARMAGIFIHTLPREVPAYDFTTGGQYYRPAGPVRTLRERPPRRPRACQGSRRPVAGCSTAAATATAVGTVTGAAAAMATGTGAGMAARFRGTDGSGCGFCSGRGLFHHGIGGSGMRRCRAPRSRSGSGATAAGRPRRARAQEELRSLPCLDGVATCQIQPAGQAVVTPRPKVSAAIRAAA